MEGVGGEEGEGEGREGGMSLPENCLTNFSPRTELKGPPAVYKIQEKNKYIKGQYYIF